jgi:hypothetical protein
MQPTDSYFPRLRLLSDRAFSDEEPSAIEEPSAAHKPSAIEEPSAAHKPQQHFSPKEK